MDGFYIGNFNLDLKVKCLEKIEIINCEIIDMVGGVGLLNGIGGMLIKIKAVIIVIELGVFVYICLFLKVDVMIEAVEEIKDGFYFVV